MSVLSYNQLYFPGTCLSDVYPSQVVGEAEVHHRPASHCSARETERSLIFTLLIRFNAVQNEMINLPYCVLDHCPRPYVIWETILKKYWIWVSGGKMRLELPYVASKAKDDLLHKINFLSTSLYSKLQDFEDRARICSVQYTLRERRRSISQAACERPSELLPLTAHPYTCSSHLSWTSVGDCLTF